MMASTLIALVAFFALALLWMDGARARELANGIGLAACQREGLQMLDGTVVLDRLALRWTRDGIRFRRMFRFDYSQDGLTRFTGYIILIGTKLESLHMTDHLPESLLPDGSGSPPPSSNVVPFRRREH